MSKKIIWVISPRPLSIVEYVAYDREKLPFKKGSRFIYLGEIPNMEGHCVVSDVKTGKVITGYHVERFKEVPMDQV